MKHYAPGIIPSSRLAQLVERVTSTIQSFNDEVSRSSRLVGIAAPSRWAFYFFNLLQLCTRSSTGYRQGHTTADHPQFRFRRIGYKSGICGEYAIDISGMDYDGILSRLCLRKAREAFLGNHSITLGAPHA